MVWKLPLPVLPPWRRNRIELYALCVLLGPAAAATAPVDAARLERADQNPANWLIYGRTYREQRFSPLARFS
jgi:glucose dehydrogenase